MLILLARVQEYQQFLCLVEDAQESEHCEEIDRLYRCLDGDTDLLSDGDTAPSGRKNAHQDIESMQCKIYFSELEFWKY